MSGLFSSLRTAAGALEVFSQALGVDQRNVANVATAGYATQRANIRTLGDPAAGAGDAVEITSSASHFADATVQAAYSQASQSQAQAQRLSPVNGVFDITGSTGVLAALQKFSSAFASLAASPNDTALGTIALSAAAEAAAAFRSAAASIDGQRTQIDAAIQDSTGRINSLAQTIRDFNVEAGRGTQIDAATDAGIRDSLDQLSRLVDINVFTNPNGSVTVLAGGELPLVIGDQAYSFSTNPNAAAGAQVISSGGGHSPASFAGQLGGLLNTRNGAFDQIIGSTTSAGTLNTLAAGFATRVNALLASGTTGSGATGVPIFIFDQVNPANAARTLSIDSTVSSSQLGLATAGPPPVANGIANQLAALPTSTLAADQISGASATGLFSLLAASIGRQLADAVSASAAGQTALTLAHTNRQTETGVSLDAEAVAITAFQRAYQANAQVVTVIDKLTLTAVNLIGPVAG